MTGGRSKEESELFRGGISRPFVVYVANSPQRTQSRLWYSSEWKVLV